MQSYVSEGVTGSNPIFIKSMGKVWKLQDCLEWNCDLRQNVLKSKLSKGDIVIEGFHQTGKIKKI